MAKIMLKNVRLAFPALWEAKSFAGQDSAKFGATLLLNKADPQIKAVEDMLQSAAVEKWGEKGKAMYQALAQQGKVCLRSGETKPDYDGFDGCMFISASNSVAPTVLDKDKSPLGATSGRPYAGCYVNASVEIWAQDNKFGKRINANLRGVQFHADGDAFAGGAPASADEFDDLSAGDDDLM